MFAVASGASSLGPTVRTWHPGSEQRWLARSATASAVFLENPSRGDIFLKTILPSDAGIMILRTDLRISVAGQTLRKRRICLMETMDSLPENQRTIMRNALIRGIGTSFPVCKLHFVAGLEPRSRLAQLPFRASPAKYRKHSLKQSITR